MPRTKQIHPRNLRDKIEEAQKELNGAEVSKKEILEAGVKGTSESLKGVKRKKIVAENHLKKIPKSPLRNPLQTKHKQNTEEPPFSVLPSASESHKKHNCVPAKQGRQFTKQNGETPGMTAESSESGDSVSPKKASSHHRSELRRWRSEGADPARLSGLDGQRDSSSSSSKTRTDNSECSSPCCSTTPPSYTSTAFDVLLRAMEPELSTLSQKGSSCAIKTEKLRPNKTVRSPSKLKNSSLDVPNATSPELVAESPCPPCTSYPVHVASTQKSEQVAAQCVSHLYSSQGHLVPKLSQHDQQLPGHLGLTGSLTNLHTLESAKLEPIYNTAMTSTVGLTSPSTRTQVTPPHQQMDSVSPSSVSPASSTQSPPGPIYSSTHVASVVSQSVEQMCSLLLRDQKPKKQGKYICEYCNRACAKPSVLLKHIRSHTGERPYPCVTCGFSFKTKSNLYKHKKSHAHTIKLGLVLQPEAGGLFLSQECPKALSVHSDIEDSGESDDEGPADGRQNDPSVKDLQPVQTMKTASNPEALPKSMPSNSDQVVSGFSSQDRPSESQALTELPKVVVHPVSIPPLKTDSLQVANSNLELPSPQSQRDLHVASILSHSASVSSLETDEPCHQKGDVIQSEGKPDSHSGTVHAQLQRQQATEDPQEQQGKLLLSPRSLGSTDSGYFSRSESADQAVSPPTPFARTFPTMDPDPAKNSGPPGPRISALAPSALATGEKSSVVTGQMRPPLATKTLEERISKLISDNEALVDDKQLDSVKPRRTSLSRRGSIDSPKSYIFKDSFQFDLKPMGRRTSSSSDIPKSPFTPTEKSKQVFLLSVPSLDCLPITRSNSMPTTGYSAIPANIIPPPPPLRGSQSFDDKIGTLYDDVFVSGPNPSIPPSGHHRPLVRQAAVEDSTASESHVPGSGQSVDESCQGSPSSSEPGPVQSKAAQTPHLEKKKSHQGRGTMFECETCRNRYRKLENFENHKKFYCSELHGPKTKAAVREAEHSPAPGGAQPQVLHYRVAAPTAVWEQTPQIRKRRKMKSVGDDEDLQPRESGRSPESTDPLQLQPVPGAAPSPSKHAPATAADQAHRGVQLVARVPERALPLKQCPMVEQQLNSAAQDNMEVKRQGGGISVIQHTNSLSRLSSFDKPEPLEGGGITFSLQELGRAGMPGALKVIGMAPEEGHPPQDAMHQTTLSHALRGEPRESARKIPSERYVLGQPLRLVRQHNIQVPEILVTEEPDRDLEAQSHDEEKSEKFTWPQRSETLSKLPTEKLPPKKKRLRLAEIEHSSTESSLESTLSRSLSRESSLSHASSFSASLDLEDISKVELAPKTDFPSKAEFLLIPLGSNTLSVPGSHREMRRAASEQISCVPTLMEVSDFRSKSFDCGSIVPSHVVPALVESQPSYSPSAVGGTGHVPLLERRRGPLIRQISLNIASDSHLSPGSAAALQTIVLPSVNTVQFQAPKLPNMASADCPAHTVRPQTLAKDLQAEMSSSSSTDTFPPQQLFGAHLLNKTNTPLSHQNTPLPLPVSAQGGKPDASPTACVSATGESSFAPKYQLQCQAFTSGQGCSATPLRPSPKQILPDQAGADPCPASEALSAKAVDPVSKPCPLLPLELRLPSDEVLQKQLPSFVLPVPVDCFAPVTSLPQILVTQDLSNMPICQTNQSLVPVSEEQNSMPKSQNCHQNALPTPEKDLACKTVLPEMGQNVPVSESSPTVQKVSVGRLSPQQESSASSKRMLSPANSLDIAMEKHQKRAKDENGAVCSTNIRPLELPSSRANESHKQKKPVLVRQLCTTEPLEGASPEQDACSASGRSSKKAANLTQGLPTDSLPSRPSPFAVTDRVNGLQEFKGTQLSTCPTPTVGSFPTSLESACVLPLKSIDNNQETGPSGVRHEESKVIQGQRQLLVSGLSLVSSSDTQQPSFPSLKTATSFTWCYLLRQKALPLAQNDQKTSAYTGWTVSSTNPNPLGLPTKVALSLLNSKQKTGKSLYCQAITTHSKSDLVVYSSKWKNNLSKRALGNQKATAVEFSNKDGYDINSEQDKENSLIQSEPRRIKIFDGGYKSNEDYVYVRGRGRGKYICEECGIRCKKPSMLKKHIRTHTDVRPYHCTYCNFSFKTKGNLTKHMKSKAHSKKCVDLGVSVGLIDEQDTEESDEKQRLGCERSGYDLEESDGPDEDDNDNEEDDDDSQAESGLSAAPSVTASPQHLPSRSGLQDPGSVEEDLRVSSCFSGVHTDPMDILPRALLTKMTVLSTVQIDPDRTDLPAEARQSTGKDEHEQAPPTDTPRSPGGHQMSVKSSESSDVLRSPAAGSPTAAVQDSSSVGLPPAPQLAARITSPVSSHPDSQDPKQQIILQPSPGLPSPQTHLFSHLPLHSQQQSRTPYNMVPVGGIHVVPAGLTYSTFVPIQAGPMQLTIPAVSVIHRTVGTSGDTITEASGAPNRTTGVAELSSVVPCIPIGQIHVPGLQNLSPPALQSLTSLGMETVNLVGLANATMGPQGPTPGLALNAVGLQVLANAPAQSSPAPPAHIPGLQILNIALPTLIPSVGPVAVGTTGTPETATPNSKATELQTPAGQGHSAEPPQGSPEGPQETLQTVPGPSADHARPEGSTKTNTKKGPSVGHALPGRSPAQAQPAPTPEALQKVATSATPSLPIDRAAPRPSVPHRQPIVHFSDVSSDDDEDRLVIAT